MTDLIRAPTPRTDPDDTGTSASPVPGPRRTLSNPMRSRPGPSGLATRCRPLARPAAYYLGSRTAMFVVAAVVAALHPKVRLVQTLGTVFDGHWYLSIAQHGYPHQLVNEGDGSRWAFFPAFPLAVAHPGRRHPAEPAVCGRRRRTSPSGSPRPWPSSWPCREVCGAAPGRSRRAAVRVLHRTAYVLSLGYGEGLFLTAAAGCLFALSRRSWVAAGLWACLAGCSRNAGHRRHRGRWWRRRCRRRGAGVRGVRPSAPRWRRSGLASFMAYSWLRGRHPARVPHLASASGTASTSSGSARRCFALVAALRHGPAASGFVPDALAGAALVLGFLGSGGSTRWPGARCRNRRQRNGHPRRLVDLHGRHAAGRLQRVLRRQHRPLRHGGLPALRRLSPGSCRDAGPGR